MQIPTIKIADANPRGWKVINADRFDPATMVEYGAAPKAEVPTRESIAKMSKTEVREWLEAHGADVPKGVTVAQMRAALVNAMFVEA